MLNVKVFLAVVALLLLTTHALAHDGVASTTSRVVIYKSDACAHCGPYVNKLLQTLATSGIESGQIQIMDFLNDPAKRSEVATLQQHFGVPLDLQGHMLTIIDGEIVLEGHVPLAAVQYALKNPLPNKPAIYFQDSMDAGATDYVLMQGNTRATYSIASGTPTKIQANGTDMVGKYGIAALVFLVMGAITILAWKR
jgi:hypothetical protein